MTTPQSDVKRLGDSVRLETTDRRYVQVERGLWWDTTSTKLVPNATVWNYIKDSDGVGLAVLDAFGRTGGQA